MLKQFWKWLRGNLTYDAIKYVLESKLVVSIFSASVAGFIGLWNKYGPLVVFFSVLFAIAIAANFANDMKRWRTGSNYKYQKYRLPVGMVLLFMVGLLALWYTSGYEVTLDQALPNHSALFRQWNAIPLTDADGTVFRNTTIVLDGKKFGNNCVFDNVTFVFNGTAPYKIGGCTIMGKNSIATGNPPLEQFAILFSQLRFHDKGIARVLIR